MKHFLLLLALLFSAYAVAGDIYQIESSSMVTGHIDLQENFEASRFTLAGEKGHFKTKLISGEPDNFSLRGTLMKDSTSKEVTLQGRLVRRSDERAVFELRSEDCNVVVVGTRPALQSVQLYETVREIVR